MPISRRHPGKLLAVVLLGATSAAALSGNALAQGSASPYRVGPGDVLSVVAYGNPALSGNYPVDDNGTIGYPILGHVPVAGMTTPQIGDSITKALVEHIAGLTATVSINTYAPVFVLGDVASPGGYHYRPGMIALELVALGGGVRKLNSTSQGVGLQFITARQQYADLALQVFALKVKRARIEAERDGVPFVFDLPAQASPAERQTEQTIIDAERNIMAVEARTMQAESDGLTAQESSFKAEIASISDAIKLHDEELASLAADVASAQALVDRKLSTDSNLRGVVRNFSAGKRDALDLLSARARAEQSLLDLGYRRTVLQNTRANAAAEALRDIDIEIARNSAAMASLMDTMGELVSIDTTAAKATARQNAATTRYAITRLIDGKRVTIPADEMTEILPGDILQTATVVAADATATAQLSE